jgi:hypothetical protein
MEIDSHTLNRGGISMEKYKFVTTETVDEILKEHTIKAIEIAAEMNARLADGNCLLGFEKLYREDCNKMVNFS